MTSDSPRYIPKRTEKHVQTKTCPCMVRAALFITGKKQEKKNKFTLIDEWINKISCIYKMEHYQAIKRNEILIHDAM